MSDLEILLKPEEDQDYFSSHSTNPHLLDILANSNSVLVRMTVLANPAVTNETLQRKIDDEEKVVWKKATEILEQRSNAAAHAS